MAFTFLFNTYSRGASNPNTSAAVDSTGADLIVIHASGYSPSGNPTVSDNQGNTWTALTTHAASVVNSKFYYCVNPTTNASHTFSSTGSQYRSITVLGFSGSDGTPFDVENGATSGGATALSTGSVTPSVDNELIVAGWTSAAGSSGTIASTESMTIKDNWHSDGSLYFGNAISYKIQTTATAINPQWSWTGSTDCAASIATFKSAGGAPAAVTFSKGYIF